MSTTLEFPCVIYGVEPDNKKHVTTQLANIAKCNDISYSEITAYSDLLAHGYGLWDKTGITENELEECYKKRHRKNYCSGMYKECQPLRSCTELFTDKMQHAHCLICDFGNKGNSNRLQKELVVLQGLLSRCINITDVKDYGGAEKIFISWSNICGHAVVGNCPIVRFTFHMYNVLEYYLLINTDSSDIKQLAMDFNSCFADSYIQMADVLKYEVDDIAEFFFNYIATHFSNYKTPSRNQVLELLEELRSAAPAKKPRKKNTVKNTSEKSEPVNNNTEQTTVIPADILASIQSELNLDLNSTAQDTPSVSMEDASDETENDSRPTQEVPPFKELATEEDQIVEKIATETNPIFETERNEVESHDTEQSADTDDEIIETDQNIAPNIEIGNAEQDAEIDVEIDKTEQITETNFAESSEETPAESNKDSENADETIQEPCDFLSPEFAENVSSPEIFDENEASESIENEENIDTTAISSYSDEDDSDSLSSNFTEKKFRTIKDKSNITMLTEFNCQRLTLHSLMDFVCAEIAIINGICGILLYVPGTNNYYFAIQTGVITGVIQHLFRSNTTILTTNISLLLNYLDRYNVKITCKTAALDLHLSLYLSSKNNEKYLVDCRNIVPLCQENAMLSHTKPCKNLMDSMTCYTEIHYLTQSNMTKKNQKKAYIWHQLEEFMAHTFAKNAINYPYALFEKTDNTSYHFLTLADEDVVKNMIQIKNITSADSLYEFFCYCCSHIHISRLDVLYTLRICSITDQEFTLSFSTSRKNDLVDSLWQLVSALYEKTFQQNCESLTIVLPERSV